jgi:hypothetical protein
MLFVVACTGPSMSPDLLDCVRARPVIAVNAVFRLAPWATALAAMDIGWWRQHRDAQEFRGRKFSGNAIDGVERVVGDGIVPGTCSGVLGLEVARRLGASRIVLVGADFHGDHYFGRYPPKLANTTTERRRVHERQFEAWATAHQRVEVVNATPRSKLRVFQRASLDEALNA